MAETISSAPSDSEGSKDKKGKGGIKAFIKKNKTLSAVVGAGGLYALWKMRQEPPAEETGGEGEGDIAESAGVAGAEAGTATLAAYEVGRSERAVERAEEETQELEEERRHEKEKNKEEKEEKEEANTPGGGEKVLPEEGGPTPETSPIPTPAAGGISIHGKTFPGATQSHIAKTGQTVGGKKFIEYTITFPGRQEHWQYFTDSNNWRQVKDSSKGAGGNNTAGGGGTQTAGTGDKNTHGGGVGAAKPKATVKVGQQKALPAPAASGRGGGGGGATVPAQNASGGAPQNNAQHPAAVNTGNKCVNGGVGGHTAPPGYHLFCQGGWIWRAPNG